MALSFPTPLVDALESSYSCWFDKWLSMAGLSYLDKCTTVIAGLYAAQRLTRCLAFSGAVPPPSGSDVAPERPAQD
jgi:hypothetical protein